MPEQAHFVGHIAELWRYPVKSMQGETLESAMLAVVGVYAHKVVRGEVRRRSHISLLEEGVTEGN